MPWALQGKQSIKSERARTPLSLYLGTQWMGIGAAGGGLVKGWSQLSDKVEGLGCGRAQRPFRLALLPLEGRSGMEHEAQQG